MESYPANAICGKCGGSRANSENAMCICGADNWIEYEDFANTALVDYVKTAANNLNITVEELLVKVFKVTSF